MHITTSREVWKVVRAAFALGGENTWLAGHRLRGICDGVNALKVAEIIPPELAKACVTRVKQEFVDLEKDAFGWPAIGDTGSSYEASVLPRIRALSQLIEQESKRH